MVPVNLALLGQMLRPDWNNCPVDSLCSSGILRITIPQTIGLYNAADIDGSKVIWAREMDAANNLELIHYYKDRTVWLVQPDKEPAEISPYTVSRQEAAALR